MDYMKVVASSSIIDIINTLLRQAKGTPAEEVKDDILERALRSSAPWEAAIVVLATSVMLLFLFITS
jgi:hypothetical protein